MANFYTPDTAVYLCNTPLNVNKKDTYAPNGWSLAAQYQFFQNLIPSPTSRYTFTDFTYQRKDGTIRVPINAEVLYSAGINYCFYRNNHYNGKVFYCFITKIEFLNENTSALHIKTDVFQTWYFEMQLKTSFVEREHTITDELYQHTLNEPLPTPEYKIKSQTRLTPDISAANATDFDNNYRCVVFTSEPIRYLAATIPRLDAFVGGVPCPCYMYATDLADYYNFIDKINENGQASAIVSCVAIPKEMVIYHDLVLPPSPDPPTPPPSTPNYLGSPFSTTFRLTNIFDPPTHRGQDLVCDVNDNVYATTSGIVVDARWENDNDHSQGYGLLVRIQSTDPNTSGAYFIYGHFNSIYVHTGDTVSAGDYIGQQGNTGFCDPPTFKHVHYQICGANGDGWRTDLINPSTLTQYPNEVGTY